MIIDPHLHVWSEDVERYPFSGESSPIGGQKGSVEFLNQTMADAGVDGAVIVQPIHYLFDNRYLADCLKQFPGKFAAQGLVDPTKPEAPDLLEELVDEHGFGGIRIHLSRYGDPTRLAARDKDALWQKASDLDVGFNLFGKAVDHPPMEAIIARFPEVKVVVDHLGCIPSNEPEPKPLLKNLLNWANYPNVYVKISNIKNSSQEPYPFPDTAPLIRKIYDAYGPERLMWGTDFPHVLEGSPQNGIGYIESLDLIRKHLFFSEEDLQWILSKSILKFWKFGG